MSLNRYQSNSIYTKSTRKTRNKTPFNEIKTIFIQWSHRENRFPDRNRYYSKAIEVEIDYLPLLDGSPEAGELVQAELSRKVHVGHGQHTSDGFRRKSAEEEVYRQTNRWQSFNPKSTTHLFLNFSPELLPVHGRRFLHHHRRSWRKDLSWRKQAFLHRR